MSTEIAKRTPMQDVLAEVASDKFLAKIKHALPENVTPERFVSVTVTAIKQNPGVIAADRDSLYNSIVRCAQDGLMPDGREAALVVYKVKGRETVQYLPMIGGLRKRLGEVGVTLAAFAVYANDDFDYELGARPTVRHKPPQLGQPRGELIGAYATATDANGKPLGLEVMGREEIERVRSVSRASQNEYGPWVQWYEEMARKTVARRLFKQLPLADTDGAMTQLLEAADAEYELPAGVGAPMSEREANLKAISRNLPDPIDEDTQVREEPGSIERPDDAQLNRLANLADAFEGDVTTYLVGAFNAGSLEELTAAQAAQAEAALRRLVGSQAEDAGEGVYEEIPFDPAPAEIEPVEAVSFEALVPESAKRQRREPTS